MTKEIFITKRSGDKEKLDLDKMHFVVEEACKGLTGVSSSQIEMNADLQFYDGMTTDEIQNILIRSANDLISLESPNYQYAAARLLLYSLHKKVYDQYQHVTLLDLIDKYKTIKVVKIIVYPAGTCFEKKATHKKNELQNQRKILFFLIAIIPKKIENNEK